MTASLPAPLIAPVLLGGGVRKRRAAIGETAPDLARARSGMTGCAYGAGGLGLVSHHGRVGDEGVSVIGWIREIVMDTSDPWRLARFWAGLLGGMPVERYPGWVTLEPPPHGQRLSFQGTGDDSAARSGAAPLVHFDVVVGDLAAGHERVVAAGAIFIGEHVSPRPGPGGQLVQWRVYQDPAGHPFCLVTR